MQHLKIHTEPKQFNCPECTKVSSSKTGLKFHIEANHREQTHTCESAARPSKGNTAYNDKIMNTLETTLKNIKRQSLKKTGKKLRYRKMERRNEQENKFKDI